MQSQNTVVEKLDDIVKENGHGIRKLLKFQLGFLGSTACSVSAMLADKAYVIKDHPVIGYTVGAVVVASVLFSQFYSLRKYYGDADYYRMSLPKN